MSKITIKVEFLGWLTAVEGSRFQTQANNYLSYIVKDVFILK